MHYETGMRKKASDIWGRGSEDVLKGVSETSLFAISQILSTNAFMATATEINWVEMSFKFNLAPRSFIQSR